MHELILFQFESTSISVVTDDHNNPWWIASEVCALLGIDDVSRACTRLDEDEKQLIRFGKSSEMSNWLTPHQ